MRESKLQLGGKGLNLNLVSTDLDLLAIDGLVLHGLPGSYSAADVVKLDKRKRGQADLLLHFNVLYTHMQHSSITCTIHVYVYSFKLLLYEITVKYPLRT
jgi:hypothetical protein